MFPLNYITSGMTKQQRGFLPRTRQALQKHQSPRNIVIKIPKHKTAPHSNRVFKKLTRLNIKSKVKQKLLGVKKVIKIKSINKSKGSAKQSRKLKLSNKIKKKASSQIVIRIKPKAIGKSNQAKHSKHKRKIPFELKGLMELNENALPIKQKPEEVRSKKGRPKKTVEEKQAEISTEQNHLLEEYVSRVIKLRQITNEKELYENILRVKAFIHQSYIYGELHNKMIEEPSGEKVEEVALFLVKSKGPTHLENLSAQS